METNKKVRATVTLRASEWAFDMIAKEQARTGLTQAESLDLLLKKQINENVALYQENESLTKENAKLQQQLEETLKENKKLEELAKKKMNL